jgi:hypothetical protein
VPRSTTVTWWLVRYSTSESNSRSGATIILRKRRRKPRTPCVRVNARLVAGGLQHSSDVAIDLKWPRCGVYKCSRRRGGA